MCIYNQVNCAESNVLRNDRPSVHRDITLEEGLKNIYCEYFLGPLGFKIVPALYF